VATNRYPKGQPIRLSTTVRDVAGVLVNAGALTLTIVKPDGTSQAYNAPTNDGTGLYHQDIPAVDLAQFGYYAYAWVSTGSGAGVAPGGFDVVDPLPVAATLYATVPELRSSLADERMALDAGQLEQALRSASRAVDDYCSRPLRRFWLDPSATVRTYRPTDPWCATVDDIGSTTGLVVKTDSAGDGTWATTWTIGTDFQLEPLNAAANGGAYAYRKIVAIGTKTFPYPSGYGGQRPTLQVTARHGWSQVPDPVREATLLTAARLYRRKDAPFGVAGFDDFGPVRITRQDSDVVALLAPYAYFGGVA
jgi:hypothetical protein